MFVASAQPDLYILDKALEHDIKKYKSLSRIRDFLRAARVTLSRFPPSDDQPGEVCGYRSSTRAPRR